MRSLRRSSRQKGASDTTGEAGEADDGSTKEHGAYYLESTAVADSGMSSKAFKKCMRLDSRRYKREHGNAVHAPDPYSNHAFLYVAPEGVDSRTHLPNIFSTRKMKMRTTMETIAMVRIKSGNILIACTYVYI